MVIYLTAKVNSNKYLLKSAWSMVGCYTLLQVYESFHLTRGGRVTHICVDKLTTIGSDNGLSPGRRQAITWTNAGILLVGPLGTNVSEILSGIQTFSFMKKHLKMSSAKWRPFCLGLNVLKQFRIGICDGWRGYEFMFG